MPIYEEGLTTNSHGYLKAIEAHPLTKNVRGLTTETYISLGLGGHYPNKSEEVLSSMEFY